MRNLLVIDDEQLILDCFRFALPEPETTVKTVTTAREGLDIFASGWPSVVVVDLRLPDMPGLDVFRQMHAQNPKIPVILITGFGTAQTAIEAMRSGAFEYIVKPIDPDQILPVIDRAFETHRLMSMPVVAFDDADDAHADDARESAVSGDVIIGRCPAMQEVYRAIGRVAPQDVTVLILGESGTGKEIVARAIYNYSKRSTGAFLAINCAAIPETLLESELFGHEKGAFTGADRQRIGKFEQCNGGTLFLDEIGDMTPLTQTKVLRVIQDQCFERIGGSQSIRTNVRLIAATNRNLEQMIESGQFRKDLFYRLNVFTIRLPPLRERTGDISALVTHYIRRFRRELQKEVTAIAPDALDALRSYSWPGNIRELQSLLKHAMLQTSVPVLTLDCFPPAIRAGRSAATSSLAASSGSAMSDVLAATKERLAAGSLTVYDDVLALVERQMLGEVMKQSSGNLSQAARVLGINRATLRTKLANLGIVAD